MRARAKKSWNRAAESGKVDAMASDRSHIDPYLFERQFKAFRAFVKEESGIEFASFASNPYTEKQEGYKYHIYTAGRAQLGFQSWKPSDIGSGKISEAAIAAIELQENNLVQWQARYGEKRRPHQPLFNAKGKFEDLQVIEQWLFTVYREEQDEKSFAGLIGCFGKTYPLLSYLFFLKDRSRYLPIAPEKFDRGFKHLGADFKTSHQCSWENYSRFLALVNEVKTLLSENLAAEVSLLDAHSFVYMLAAQMESANKLANVKEYLSLSESEREAIVKARIGQGRFRQSLIDYWSGCAVTGCLATALLHASHIKPWAQANLKERLSLFNGLLLSPNLDTCFDKGYISFDDDGRILISNHLTAEDASVLGVHADMRLSRIEPEHKYYLNFHRTNVFKA
jgi:predicted restriction endonuclease